MNDGERPIQDTTFPLAPKLEEETSYLQEIPRNKVSNKSHNSPEWSRCVEIIRLPV